MAKFHVKVFHRSSEGNVDRAWQPATQPVQPVHEEVFDAISRDVVLLQVAKKYPRYAEEKYGYTLEVNKVY